MASLCIAHVASELQCTALQTWQGGSLTLESVAGSFTQIWRIRELEASTPFPIIGELFGFLQSGKSV